MSAVAVTTGGGRRGRRALVAGAALVAAALTANAAIGTRTGSPAPARPTVATSTADVVRRTLTEKEEVDGTLGYGETRPVLNRGQGTYTRLAAEGSTIERNGVLYEIDNAPVRLLYGDVPAYRRLAEDAGDGPDVAQLEANLVDMGFAKGLISKPNEDWDSATTAAVKRWQKSLGVDQDGVVEDGEVVFLPGPVRIGSREAEAGSQAQPAAAVYKVTGTQRQVRIDLDARKQRLAHQGAKVEVVLPDGTTAPATITAVGTVAKTSGGGGEGEGGGDDESTPTIAVIVTLDDADAGGTLDGAPVDVRLTAETRENVLAVPVHALLALAEGGYGVEVVGGGSRRLVRVETGLFADGYVEVTGEELAESTKVVVPE